MVEVELETAPVPDATPEPLAYGAVAVPLVDGYGAAETGATALAELYTAGATDVAVTREVGRAGEAAETGLTGELAAAEVAAAEVAAAEVAAEMAPTGELAAALCGVLVFDRLYAVVERE